MVCYMKMWFLSSGPVQTEVPSATSLPALMNLIYGKSYVLYLKKQAPY